MATSLAEVWPKSVAEAYIYMSEVVWPMHVRSVSKYWPSHENTGQSRPDIVLHRFGRILAENGHFGDTSASLSIALYS